MSSSEDYESESCPESDKSALLLAQVKLPCEFLSDPVSFRTNQVGLPSGYK